MANIEIRETLGVSAADVLQRRHNLWIGVSDSPWYNQPNSLEELIRWGLVHTRERLALFIPGRMYAANILHVEQRSRARALRDGFAAEDRFRVRVEKMFTHLPEQRARMNICGYDEFLTPEFVRRRSILYRAFSEEGEFYRRVIEIAADYLRTRGRTVTTKVVEAAAVYQLQELPMFVAPVRLLNEATSFTAEIYPGLGKFDQLARDLMEGKEFPELTEKLRLTEACGVVGIRWNGES